MESCQIKEEISKIIKKQAFDVAQKCIESNSDELFDKMQYTDFSDEILSSIATDTANVYNLLKRKQPSVLDNTIRIIIGTLLILFGYSTFESLYLAIVGIVLVVFSIFRLFQRKKINYEIVQHGVICCYVKEFNRQFANRKNGIEQESTSNKSHQIKNSLPNASLSTSNYHKKKKGSLVKIIVIILVVGYIGAQLSEGKQDNNSSRRTSEGDRISSWIWKSKETVKNRLKDSSSAKFRNVFFCQGQDNKPMVCGEVNAKNSFGAYSGYERFIAAGDVMAVLESDFSSYAEFADSWDRFCKSCDR